MVTCTRLVETIDMAAIGRRIRDIRRSRNLTQRELADRVRIHFTYLSRIENDRLDADQTPREDTLQKIADALDADAEQLLLLARRIPESFRLRILAKPDMFRRLLTLSDDALERLLIEAEKTGA